MGTSCRGSGGDTWPSPSQRQSALSHPRSSWALPKSTSPARNYRKVGLDKMCLLMEGTPRSKGNLQSTTLGYISGLCDQPTTHRPTDRPTIALVERMESEIDHLWEQLDKEREANRENHRLLAVALERIPAIEGGGERDTPVIATLY